MEEQEPRYKSMSFQLLQSFCYVARYGSVTQAAKHLGYRQPTISQQIKALEDYLGVKLFTRGRNRLEEITDDGRKLLMFVEPLIEQFDTVQEQIKEEYGKLQKKIIIAAGQSAILYLLPDAIEDFKKRYPEVNLKILNRTAREILQMMTHDSLKVEREQIDFAVTSLLKVPDSLQYTEIRRYENVLITAERNPLTKKAHITVEDIAKQPLILPERGSTTYQQITQCLKKRGLNCQIIMETGGWEVIKCYVGLDMGVSIMPELCIKSAKQEGLCVHRLDGLFDYRSYGIVTKREKHIPQHVWKLICQIASHWKANG